MLIFIFYKKGFTLSEVLITLAIVAIVATMTIPSIVVSNQKTELEARFAKSYRTITYAVNMAIAENGGIETWEWKETYSSKEMDEFVKTYFLPYLNVVKFCPSDNSVAGCFPDITYKFLNGKNWINIATSKVPKALLSDGTAIQFGFINSCFKDKNRCMSFRIDTNGVKKPNKEGVDTFLFNLYPQTSEFLPHGIYFDKSYDEQTGNFERIGVGEEGLDACTKSGQGGVCAAKIIQDGFKINYDW